MKIGIITQPLRFNYGGILQAYALQTVLECMGHEAFVVRKSEKKKMRRLLWPAQYAKRIFLRLIGYNTIIFVENKTNKWLFNIKKIYGNL
jgi:hypothetical protein